MPALQDGRTEGPGAVTMWKQTKTVVPVPCGSLGGMGQLVSSSKAPFLRTFLGR